MATAWLDDRKALRSCDSPLALGDTLVRLATHEDTPDATRRRGFEIEANQTKLGGTDLTNTAGQVVDSMKDSRVKREFQPYQIEGASPDGVEIRSAKVARAELLSLLADLQRGVQAAGARYTSIADGRCWGAHRVNLTPPEGSRHWKMTTFRMPGVYFGAVDCSFQTHTANGWELGDRTMWYRMLVEQHVALLLAASANSFNTEEDLSSQRYLQSRGVWSFTLGSWTTFGEFVDQLHKLIKARLADGPWDIHPWAKICKHTLEQRVCDTVGDARELLSLHAVSHAISLYCMNMARRASCASELPLKADFSGQMMLTHALETAARFGLSRMDNRIVSPYSDDMVSIGDQFADLRHRIGPIMIDGGYGWEEQYFFDVMIGKQENGAERQRRWWKEPNATPLTILEHDSGLVSSSLTDAYRNLSNYERISEERRSATP